MHLGLLALRNISDHQQFGKLCYWHVHVPEQEHEDHEALVSQKYSQ
jgi:hypothetical protein